MWQYLVTHYLHDMHIKPAECMYVGDAAGREGDHSDADKGFAENAGMTQAC